MKFQVESVEFDDQFVKISESSFNDENLYTMLVGRNATGKTRTLSKIANHFLFPSDGREVRNSLGSSEKPSRVIAISNSRFDRFPDPVYVAKKKSVSETDYFYLGLSGFRATPSTNLTRGCEALFQNDDSNKFKISNIATILEYIGFLPYIHIDFRIPVSVSGYGYNKSIDEAYQLYYKKNSSKSAYDQLDIDYRFREALKFYDYKFRSGKTASFQVDLGSYRSYDPQFEEFSKHAEVLLQSGLLRVARLNLFHARTKDKIPFHLASSGQQCMLLMFLGIAGVIADGSLICIDEPEISLHPRWQAEFIGLLQVAFSNYRGCHFVIATHSPQIISGLTSANGFVSDLEEHTLVHASKYAQRSADFQLTEVFHEPGFRNEYLIRSLLVMLSKLTKEEKLDGEDLIKLNHFYEVKPRLKDGDPVLHLLNQINMLLK